MNFLYGEIVSIACTYHSLFPGTPLHHEYCYTMHTCMVSVANSLYLPPSLPRSLSPPQRGTYQEAEFDLVESQTKSTTHMLNLQKDYSIQLSSDEPTMLRIYPTNPKISNFRSFRISCPNSGDVEQWYQALQQSNCLPPICVSPTPVTARSSMRKKVGQSL